MHKSHIWSFGHTTLAGRYHSTYVHFSGWCLCQWGCVYEKPCFTLPHSLKHHLCCYQSFIKKPSIFVHMYLLLPEQLDWWREDESELAECCFVWIIESLSLLMVYIIQVPSRHAFRNSFAWGNGEQRPGFRPLIIPLMWQAGKKSSPTGLAPTSPLIIDESGLRV